MQGLTDLALRVPIATTAERLQLSQHSCEMKSTAELRAEAEQRMRDKKAGLPAGRPRASPAASIADLADEVESLQSLRSRVSERSRISGRTSEVARTAASREGSQQSRKSVLEQKALTKSENGSEAAKENLDPNIDIYEKIDGVYKRITKREQEGLSESSRGQAQFIF